MHSPPSSQPDPIAALTADERACVESLLATITQPRLASELAGQDAAVAAISARIRPRRPRRPVITFPPLAVPAIPLRGRAVRVVAATACILAATAGAAIAGTLPAAVQGVAHGVLRHVGVSVPDGGHATHALGSTPGPGAGMSTTARDRSSTRRAKGAAVSAVASRGTSRAGATHGSTGRGSDDGSGSSGDSPEARRRSATHPQPNRGAAGQASTHARGLGQQAGR